MNCPLVPGVGLALLLCSHLCAQGTSTLVVPDLTATAGIANGSSGRPWNATTSSQRVQQIYGPGEFGFHIARINGGVGSLGDMPGTSVMVAYVASHDITIVSLANLTATVERKNAASELGETTLAILAKHAPKAAEVSATTPR